MTAANTIPELKRIQFFSGQRLTAQDLTDVQAANRELRWLHNRSLHGWGIGIGYGVMGDRGDTSVTVGAGYAIDCVGRELILTAPVTMTIPAIAGNSDGGAATFFLTVSYMENAGQSTVETRPGVCLPAGTVRLTEGPLIQWQTFEKIQEGINVILAQASVLNCQLNSALELGVRRSARPSQQPYINAGQVSPAQLLWTALPDAAGISTHIDTSAGQFHATPAYFAHVVGSREMHLFAGTPGVLLTLDAISHPAPDGFDCDVYLLGQVAPNAPMTLLNPALIAALLNSLEWTVVWMGVEG